MNIFSLVVAIFVAVAAVNGAIFNRVVRSTQPLSGGQAYTLNGLAAMAKLGERNSFRPTNDDMIISAKGVKRCRLTQTYNGMDVHGASAEAELDTNDQLTGQMYGHVCSRLEGDIPDPDACIQNCDDMIDQAIMTEGFTTTDSDISQKDCKRMVYVEGDSGVGHISYRVEFFYAGPEHVAFPAYFIDACDTSVLASFNQVQNVSISRVKRQQEEECETDSTTAASSTTRGQTSCAIDAAGVGGNEKVGLTTYNTAPFCLNVRKDGDTCYMENTYARVIDNQQSTSRSKTEVVSFECTQGYSDAINGGHGVANDAMFFGDITGRLYVERYNVRALPYAPRLVVHYDSCYDNAFWNGVDMFFGDGCSFFYPLVNQDVVTHELGHGITTRNSNLEYRRQSGGINEAFSDISGEVAEVFGRSSHDWQVGRELFKGNGALRYFINPPDDRRSIKHVSDYTDGMDVHYSSGIYNHAFYQLVEAQSMNIFDAYACFLKANLLLWRPTTGFEEGACDVMQACFDEGFGVDKVKAAFEVVGVTLNDQNCPINSLNTIVYMGTSRDNILVSSVRNPVLEIDIGDIPSITISTTNDAAVSIQVTVSTDVAGQEIVTSGSDSVTFDNPGMHSVQVMLSSTTSDDVKVSMTIG